MARTLGEAAMTAGRTDKPINVERRKRNHIHQLEALGYKVTVEPAA